MAKPFAWIGQGVLYALFAVFIGYFSNAPAYQHLPEGAALLRLSFKHAGRIQADCRARTPEELAKMPRQLRALDECPRARSPVRVRVDLDGHTLVDEAFPAAGLRHDGAASGYRRIQISSGEHLVRVAVNDDVRVAGYNHERTERVTVRPGQVLLIDFVADQGGILIK